MSDVRYAIFMNDPVTGVPKEGVNFKITRDGGTTFLPSPAGVDTDITGQAYIDVDMIGQYDIYIDNVQSTIYQGQTIIPLVNNLIPLAWIEGGGSGGGANVPKTHTIGTSDTENQYDFPATATGLQDAINGAAINDIIVIYEAFDIVSTNISVPANNIRIVNARSLNYTIPEFSSERIGITLEDSYIIGTGTNPVITQGIDFIGFGSSGFRDINVFSDDCSFQNDDAEFGGLVFEDSGIRGNNTYLLEVSFDINFGGSVSTRNIFLRNSTLGMEDVAFIHATNSPGSAIIELENCSFESLGAGFYEQVANVQNSTITFRTKGYNSLPVGTDSPPDFAPFNQLTEGFWSIQSSTAPNSVDLYKITRPEKDHRLEKYYPFEQEVTVDLTDVSGIPTQVSSSLSWDSTVNGVIDIDYILVQAEFGTLDRSRKGHLSIIIQGNSTAGVFLDDMVIHEINDQAKTECDFSIDVLSNQCRLLHTAGTDTSVHFYNIKYATFVNNSGGGG